MTEKRRHPRYSCSIKANFDYYEGNPSEIDMEITVPSKGKGFILDISQSGMFMVSDERVSIGLPVRASFSLKKGKFSPMGRIVRTGMLKNNPSEIARKFSQFSSKGDFYIAVEFDSLLPDISEKDI